MKKAKKMESSNNSSPISTSTETSPTLTPTTASPLREHQPMAKPEQSDGRQMSEDGDHVPEAVVEDNCGSEAADQVDQDAKTPAEAADQGAQKMSEEDKVESPKDSEKASKEKEQ